MENENKEIRDGLLSRLPQPGNLAGYRKEVARVIERNETRLRRDKWGAGATWLAVIALSVAFFWGGGGPRSSAEAAWLGTMACFWMIFGAVELLKYFINRTRVELLKETKQVQLQVLELHALMRGAMRSE